MAADEQALTADARRLGAEGLRAADLDRSLLLSAAGVRLHDSVDTRTNLLATLDRAHQLLRTHRTGTAVNLTVNPATGQVALAMPFDGVALFDGSTLQELHHDPQVRGPGLVSSPDGHLYAASLMPELTGEASDPPAVTLLDERGAVSSVQLGGVPSNRYAQQELSFSPNGRWLVVGLLHREGAAPPVTVVWDLTAPGRPAALVQLGDQDHSPVVSDDGRTLYGAGGGHVRVVDLAGGRGPVMLDAADLDVREVGDQLRLHPDGRTLAVGAGDEVALLDTHSLTTRAVLSGHGRTDALAFSRDGRRLASAGEEVVAWDLSGGQPRELLRHEDPSGASLGFSPDARTLYTVEQSGLLLAWDLDGDRSFLRTHPGEALAREAPAVIRFSPDRRKIGYVWGSPAAVQVRDGATGALGPLIDVRLRQRSWIDLAWSPDSRHFNVTTGDGTVGIWDATTGRNLASHTLVQAEGSTTRPGPTGATEGASIAFWSLDGRFLLVGSTTGRLHVLDGRTLAPVHEPVQVTSSKEGGRTPPVQGLEPSPDLRTVVTFGDQTRVVDYVDGVVEPPLGYGGDRATIAFAPRGAGPSSAPPAVRWGSSTPRGDGGWPSRLRCLPSPGTRWCGPRTAAAWRRRTRDRSGGGTAVAPSRGRSRSRTQPRWPSPTTGDDCTSPTTRAVSTPGTSTRPSGCGRPASPPAATSPSPSGAATCRGVPLSRSAAEWQRAPRQPPSALPRHPGPGSSPGPRAPAARGRGRARQGAAHARSAPIAPPPSPPRAGRAASSVCRAAAPRARPRRRRAPALAARSCALICSHGASTSAGVEASPSAKTCGWRRTSLSTRRAGHVVDVERLLGVLLRPPGRGRPPAAARRRAPRRMWPAVAGLDRLGRPRAPPR